MNSLKPSVQSCWFIFYFLFSEVLLFSLGLHHLPADNLLFLLSKKERFSYAAGRQERLQLSLEKRKAVLF